MRWQQLRNELRELATLAESHCDKALTYFRVD